MLPYIQYCGPYLINRGDVTVLELLLDQPLHVLDNVQIRGFSRILKDLKVIAIHQILLKSSWQVTKATSTIGVVVILKERDLRVSSMDFF